MTNTDADLIAEADGWLTHTWPDCSDRDEIHDLLTRLADRLATLTAEGATGAGLAETVANCGIMFRSYEQQHLAKTPPDHAKARRNADMAAQCEAALAAATAEGATGVPEGWKLVPVKATARMIAYGEGYADFVLPSGFENTQESRRREMAMAYGVMVEAAPNPPDRPEQSASEPGRWSSPPTEGPAPVEAPHSVDRGASAVLKSQRAWVQHAADALKALLAEQVEYWRLHEAWRALEATTDDPDLDATDAAHPAWWRGHDHTSKVFCELVTDILDGKDPGGGFNHEPWHTLRRRLLAKPRPLPSREMIAAKVRVVLDGRRVETTSPDCVVFAVTNIDLAIADAILAAGREG